MSGPHGAEVTGNCELPWILDLNLGPLEVMVLLTAQLPLQLSNSFLIIYFDFMNYIFRNLIFIKTHFLCKYLIYFAFKNGFPGAGEMAQ